MKYLMKFFVQMLFNQQIEKQDLWEIRIMITFKNFQSEYDDDRIDLHHGNQEPEEAPDNMDLPDDLKLDEEEAGVTEEEQGQGQIF